MKKVILLFSVLFACQSTPHKKNIVPPANVREFEDAKEFRPDWSKENTLIFHFIAEPDNLHPTNGNSITRSEVLQYVHRSLLYIDFKTMKIEPGLVEALPEISPDSLRYTYTLKKNITWDDGKELTTNDVIFTGKAIKCQFTNNSAVKFYWSNVKNIIAHNERVFTIEMRANNFQNISFLTAFPVLEKSFYDPGDLLTKIPFTEFNEGKMRKEVSEAMQSWANVFNDDSYGRDPQKIYGLGMYRVEKWEPGQFITLVKKPNHWTKGSTSYLESAHPEKIIFQLNKDEASQVLDFRNQKLDVSTNCSVNVLTSLSEEENFNRNYNTALIPTYNYTYICFNERPGEDRAPLFTEAKVRRAIASLTKVEDLTKITYREYSSQCRRMVTNVSPLKSEYDSLLKPVAFDADHAKKLLTEAGWVDSDNDGIRDKTIDGKKIKMSAELLYLNTSPEWKNMAVYLAEQYAKSGIEIRPVAAEVKLFLEKAKTHDFDLLIGSWGGTGLSEDYAQLWHTNSWTTNGSNYSGFGNEQSDRIIEEMKTAFGGKRIILSRELQKIIYDDQPFVFLYCSMRRNIIHKRFGNQLLFSERPGILCSDLWLLSKSNGITMNDEVTP